MTVNTNSLFCFGLGYSARALARRLIDRGWRVAGTCRSDGQAETLRAIGVTPHIFDGRAPVDEAAELFDGVTHVLSSIAPDESGDPVLNHHTDMLVRQGAVQWLGYLSSTAVYGNRDGALVDEFATPKPDSARARRRVAAERAWLDLFARHGRPVHVFRLAGIYGPGRSALDQVGAGAARRIDKPGHMFARIHVDDIAHVIRASMARPNPGAIYNVCDDEAAASADVTGFACGLLGTTPPPLIPFAEAVETMSPMARSFWADNRRVDNRRIHRELGVRLQYPSYREGLRAILGHSGG